MSVPVQQIGGMRRAATVYRRTFAAKHRVTTLLHRRARQLIRDADAVITDGDIERAEQLLRLTRVTLELSSLLLP